MRVIFAALTFSREREFGTLEQLLVMPFTSLEIILGKSIPVIMVGLFDFSLMLGVVHFAFHVPIRGSLLLLFCLAFMYTLVELGKDMARAVDDPEARADFDASTRALIEKADL